MTAYTDDDVTAVALAILRVSAPEAEVSDLTDVDLDEARAALAVAEPAIRADEREACAVIAESHEWFVGGIGTVASGSGESRAIAAAIRARNPA